MNKPHAHTHRITPLPNRLHNLIYFTIHRKAKYISNQTKTDSLVDFVDFWKAKKKEFVLCCFDFDNYSSDSIQLSLSSACIFWYFSAIWWWLMMFNASSVLFQSIHFSLNLDTDNQWIFHSTTMLSKTFTCPNNIGKQIVKRLLLIRK